MSSMKFNLMNNISLFIISAVFLLSSCATKVASIYNQDVNVAGFHSFLVKLPASKSSLSEENKFLDDRLQQLITVSLVNKGLTTSSLPDLYVSYFINVYSTSETSNNNYGSPYLPYSYYPNSFDYTTRTYKTGVFIIDIKDSKGMLVWQGSKSFKFRSKQPVSEVVTNVCREVIEAFMVANQ